MISGKRFISCYRIDHVEWKVMNKEESEYEHCNKSKDNDIDRKRLLKQLSECEHVNKRSVVIWTRRVLLGEIVYICK